MTKRKSTCVWSFFWNAMDMVERVWWGEKIIALLERRSIVWLSEVRRVRKTMLCRGIEGIRCYDCGLPSVRRELVDPEAILQFVELLLAQSAGRFNAAAFATACEVSLPTIANFLSIL